MQFKALKSESFNLIVNRVCGLYDAKVIRDGEIIYEVIGANTLDRVMREVVRWLRDKGYSEMKADSPYAVICETHGSVELDFDEYNKQMFCADNKWKCPVCGADACFDDENWESYFNV